MRLLRLLVVGVAVLFGGVLLVPHSVQAEESKKSSLGIAEDFASEVQKLFRTPRAGDYGPLHNEVWRRYKRLGLVIRAVPDSRSALPNQPRRPQFSVAYDVTVRGELFCVVRPTRYRGIFVKRWIVRSGTCPEQDFEFTPENLYNRETKAIPKRLPVKPPAGFTFKKRTGTVADGGVAYNFNYPVGTDLRRLIDEVVPQLGTYNMGPVMQETDSRFSAFGQSNSVATTVTVENTPVRLPGATTVVLLVISFTDSSVFEN